MFKTSSENFLLDRRASVMREIEILEKEAQTMTHPRPGLMTYQLKYLNQYATSATFKSYTDEWIRVNDALSVLHREFEQIDSRIAFLNDRKLEYQSAAGEISDGPISSNLTEIHDTVTDVGGEEVKYEALIDKNVTFLKTSHDLEGFFNRPIQIATFPIPLLTAVKGSYKVCDLYLNDPSIRAKLRNFAYLKAKFHVKIAISGTPFDYGRAICAVYPWATDIAPLTTLSNSLASWDLLRVQYYSQAKLSGLIDFKENKPLEFELPWVSPMPVGRLYNNSASALASGTSYDDFTDMWTLYFQVLNQLKCVSSTPSAVYVNIYAYMSEVELGVPTATQTVIALNSKTKMHDERKTGPVEKMSSSMVQMSQMLESAPLIGPYAKASTMAFGTLKDIASLFGWSAPVIDSVPSRVKNEPFQNGASLIQRDTGQRLTLDPKQELSVSTEYVAESEDELIIANFVNRISYFSTFTWNHATAPMNPIQFFVVHPRLTNGFIGAPSGTKNVVPTPMNMMSQAFTKWHGTIEFTIEIVCSAFHRGKLLIMYEPNIAAYTSILATGLTMNKQFAHVIDIQETQRYSVCVEWNFPRHWADNLPDSVSFNTMFGAGITGPLNFVEAANGYLIIAPFTQLQSPDNSDVEINVYLRGKDFAFNRLSTQYMPQNKLLQYNSGTSITNVEESCIPINEDCFSREGMAENFYGEQPLSIRALLKRFIVATQNAVPTGAAGQRTYTLSSPIFSSEQSKFGVVSTGYSLFNHFRFCFLAMRGSNRKRINWISDLNAYYSPVYVRLGQENVAVAATSSSSVSGITVGPTIDGTLTFVPHTNAGVEFELPFYSNNLFVFACSTTPYTPTCAQFDQNGTTGQYLLDMPFPIRPGILHITESEATGEDFQLSYFIGCVPYVSA